MVEVILKNRHGRKRKSGRRRYSNGRLVAEKGIDRLIIAARMPHRGPIPQNLLLDQKSECELGRMCLLGRITEEQYSAGRIYAGLVARYRAVLGGPAALTNGAHGFDCLGESPCPDCECMRRKNQWQEAHDALRTAGHDAVYAVQLVVLEDKELPRGHRPDLRPPLIWGLSALKQHFGLAPRHPLLVPRELLTWRNP